MAGNKAEVVLHKLKDNQLRKHKPKHKLRHKDNLLLRLKVKLKQRRKDNQLHKLKRKLNRMHKKARTTPEVIKDLIHKR